MITNLPMFLQLFRILFCWLFLLCVLSANTYAQEAWLLAKETDQVQVYSRKTDSGLDEVRVVTQVKADYRAILKLLDDINAAPRWVANCKMVENLGWFGERERTVHTFFSSPWPLSDRDMVTHSVASIDESNQVVLVEVSDHGQKQQILSHYVRFEDVKGQWTSKQIDENISEISYQGYADPAGTVPNWLANRLAISASLETFEKMRKHIVSKQYHPAVKP